MSKKIICIFLALLLCISLTVSVSALGDTEFLYDDADLLSAAEEAALRQKLATVSDQYEAQIVIVTLSSIEGGNIDFYLDYLYDNMGFGYGERHDGVLLLLCMDIREYRILSNGYAGVAIDPGNIDAICDEIVSNLSDGDYSGAFDEFVDECVYYLDGYINGYPFNAGEHLTIALAIGILIGLIVVLILKGQLKTVHKQSRAHDYVKSGSMRVNVMNDIFLYRNVTRTAKPKNTSSGSGGSSRRRGGGSF